MSRRQPHRVYLDSRFANADGSVDIPNGGIQTHPDSNCWMTEFSTTASWWTVDESNQYLYVRERIVELVDGLEVVTWNNRKLAPRQGPYDHDSLATEIAYALNNGLLAKDPDMGTYTCTRVSGAPSLGGGGGLLRCFEISASNQFQLPSEAGIRAAFDVEPYELARNTNYLFAFPQGDESASSHTSTLCDLRRCRHLFIHCEGFGTFNCTGPVGGGESIIAKIPCDAGYGQLLDYNFTATELEKIPVGTHAVTRVKLVLKDVFGSVVSLQGAHWSATLVFE